MQAGPQTLRPFYGPPRGFSFPTEIQPILDQHCIRCHDDSGRRMGQGAAHNDPNRAFSLLGLPHHDPFAKRHWNEAYLNLTQARPFVRDGKPHAFQGQMNEWVDWPGAQSVPSMLPPYTAGAATSRLLTLLEDGHYDVQLDREARDKLACWIDLFVPYCGDYTEAHAWSGDEQALYARFVAKREAMATIERENIAALVAGEGAHARAPE